MTLDFVVLNMIQKPRKGSLVNVGVRDGVRELVLLKYMCHSSNGVETVAFDDRREHGSELGC